MFEYNDVDSVSQGIKRAYQSIQLHCAGWIQWNPRNCI